MIEGERYFFENGRRLFNEYADGKVRTFLYENGLRTTEITLGQVKIIVAREDVPLIIPADYGRIIVQNNKNEEILPIKRPLFTTAFFLVESKEGILGWAKGNRFDLALAYELGVEDPELKTDKQDTIIESRIPNRVLGIALY